MNNLIGKIHSIESFGTVDGPGIRFVIFMQGCNLHCQFCHNRDTWDVNSGKNYSVDELITQILRYKNYIIPSGGGVTVTGGEPLLQAGFVYELFKQLHKLNIHTVLDTSGSFKINNEIKELLNFTNLVLLDIKHINNDKCIDLTGFSNTNTLDFEKYLDSKKIPVWIRQVIIPGITDNKDDLLKLKKFISSYYNIEKVELLPYHTLGKYKWKNLKKDYPLEGIRQANNDDINNAKEILGI